MEESCSCEDHGVVVGPLGGVAPSGPGAVPVVAPRRVTYDTLGKTLPHDKGKIHLWGGQGGEEGRAEERRGGTLKTGTRSREELGKRRRWKYSEHKGKQINIQRCCQMTFNLLSHDLSASSQTNKEQIQILLPHEKSPSKLISFNYLHKQLLLNGPDLH